jgi:tetratricopeptide (TPR) repeat protein
LTAGVSRRGWLAGTAAAVLGLGGCATQTAALRAGAVTGLPRRTELEHIPFFPQGGPDLCGPETLATVLQAQGFAQTPADLVPLVYLPGRRGSLQVEMLAAARRCGAVAVRLPPTLQALCEEIAAGHPVLVLQNLGLSLAPAWHYAVAVGYDLDDGWMILRSGRERRQHLALRTFEHTWARSQHWAFVALAPGRLPRTATEDDMARALVAFERVAPPERAVQAYEAARARWSDNLTIAMGLGNSLYAAGRKAEAAQAFEAAARAHASAAAWVNLGLVALDLGQRERALAAAREALTLGGPWADRARALVERVESQP